MESAPPDTPTTILSPEEIKQSLKANDYVGIAPERSLKISELIQNTLETVRGNKCLPSHPQAFLQRIEVKQMKTTQLGLMSTGK